MKSMMMIPPRLRRRSWRAIAVAASRLVLKMVSLEVAMADEGAGVHVDGGHRLGRIDDQAAAGLQQYLALQGFLDFVLDAVEIEDRSLARVMFEAIGNLRHQFFDEGSDLLEVLSRVDADLLDPRSSSGRAGYGSPGTGLRRSPKARDGLDLRGDLVP